MRDPLHGIIANLFSLQRLGTGITRETDALLRALFDDLVAQIAKIDPTAVARRTFRRKRLETLLGEIETLVGQEVPKLRSLVRKRLIEIGGQQAEWATTQLEGTIGVVGVVGENRITPKFFRAIVDEDPFQGETLRGWFRSIQDSTIRRIRRQLQLGMAQNETIDDMVRRVRGRRVGRRFRGGVMQATTRDAETVVRTGVNHIANRAHHEVHRANADIVTRAKWASVIDHRTSPICRALDGQEWELDDPELRLPPAHPNCRSVSIPVISDETWRRLGLQPPPEGTRASSGGQIPASTTYEQWLKGQPPAVQDEILGPTRAKLFRDGKINLRDLVRTDGSSVTVAELRKAAA